jgi:hypothetical protein
MRHSWRINLVLALLALYCGATANAQAVGVPGNGQGGADPGGGLSQPGLPDNKLEDPSVRTPPPAQQRSFAHYGRVTSTRRQVVVSPPPGVVARLGGTSAAAGVAGQGGFLRPYSAQAAQRAGRGVDPRVPAGSSWQESRRPAPPPSITMRSTTHNYYPTMRPALGPNANVPPPSRARRYGMGSTAASTMMMGSMMPGAQRQVARRGQSASPGGGPAGLAPGGR